MRCQGGDLRSALAEDEDGKYAWERHGKQVAMDVARGLHFLHASGVEHGCEPCRTSQLLRVLHRGIKWSVSVAVLTTVRHEAPSRTHVFAEAAYEVYTSTCCGP